ncbi:hypothetical protein SAMN05216275_1901, partial [Streptosporangium canum]
MPKKDHSRKSKIRRRMAATGEPYWQAAQAIDALDKWDSSTASSGVTSKRNYLGKYITRIIKALDTSPLQEELAKSRKRHAAMIRAAAVPATARIQEELAKSREQHAAMI